MGRQSSTRVSLKTHAIISAAAYFDRASVKEQIERMGELLPFYLKDLHSFSKKDIERIYSPGRATITRSPKSKQKWISVAISARLSRAFGKAAFRLGVSKTALIDEIASHSFINSAHRAGHTIDEADRLYQKIKVKPRREREH